MTPRTRSRSVSTSHRDTTRIPRPEVNPLAHHVASDTAAVPALPAERNLDIEAVVAAHPELAAACKELESLGAKQIEANSVRTYASAFRKFRTWCDSMKLTALPATPEAVLLYLGHLKAVGAAPSTVDIVRSGISWVHEDHDLANPVAHARVIEGFKAYHRWWAGSGLAKGTKQAHPLSVPEVINMIEVLPKVPLRARGLAASDGATGRALLRSMLRAELLTAWHLGRRLDEIVRAELSWLTDNGGDQIEFRSTSQKAKPGGFANVLQRTKDPRLCPVTALREWLDLSAPYRFGEQHIFGRIAASEDHPICLVPVTLRREIRQRGSAPYADFLSETNQKAVDESRALGAGITEHRRRLVRWMQAAGVQPVGSDRRLGGHSMRRGLVTELHKAGVGQLEIANHIGWADPNLIHTYSDHQSSTHPIERLGL